MTVDHLPFLIEAAAEQERRAWRRGLAFTILPLVLGIVWLVVSFMQVHQLEARAEQLRKENERQRSQVVKLRKLADTSQRRLQRLAASQDATLQFLSDVTAAENIRLVDQSVDWGTTKAKVIGMEPGVRKTAVLGAILLAWKQLPFSTNNRTLASGLDSPHFINVVLRAVGAEVRAKPGQRLSDAMMTTFQRVEHPLPGDLVFYKGNVGSFVVMYIAPGAPTGKGVAVGTLQTGEEVQVLDTANLNTAVYPLIGVFRVPYESIRAVPHIDAASPKSQDSPEEPTRVDPFEKGP